MLIKVKVFPCSKKEGIIKKKDGFEVRVKEKPFQNKANQRVLEVLKQYFKSEVKLVKGGKKRNKVFKVYENNS